MKIGYVVALLMIAFIVGCAAPKTQPEAPAEEPTAEVEEPPEPTAAAIGEQPAEEIKEVAIDADIQILSKAFDPGELTVSAGSTVTWINMDKAAVHSLSIIGKGVICQRKQTGETCEYTFEEAGTYEIMDLVNKFRGKVIVTGGEAEEE